MSSYPTDEQMRKANNRLNGIILGLWSLFCAGLILVDLLGWGF